MNKGIQCENCGFGILAKKRERRPIVYNAI